MVQVNKYKEVFIFTFPEYETQIDKDVLSRCLVEISPSGSEKEQGTET